ncbi:MAG: hypothetical protein K6E10_06370 [Eubacterium sp.]|nr:hypothetical protein [Eubacterium sp.]
MQGCSSRLKEVQAEASSYLVSATVYYNADNVKTINDDTFIIGSFLLSDMGDIPIEKIVHYELVGKEKILPLILLSSGDNNLITKMVIKK